MLICRATDFDFPALPFAEWNGSKEYLHHILQMVGKVRLSLHPKLNHWWHVTLYPSTRGLTTGLIPYCGRDFEIEVDLQLHQINLHFSEGPSRHISLGDSSVAEVYSELFQQLEERQFPITIHAHPYLLQDKTPFSANTAKPDYNPLYVQRYHQVLNEISNIFQEFRGRYNGKASPVHWFWHSFDLAYTRFSGRKAPPRTTGTRVDQEAYSHEEISFGFWPGDNNFPEAAFYAYCYPHPDGLTDQLLQPEKAIWGELNGSPYGFLLYEDMRNSANPRLALLEFLESFYQAAAKQAGWPVEELSTTALAHT